MKHTSTKLIVAILTVLMLTGIATRSHALFGLFEKKQEAAQKGPLEHPIKDDDTFSKMTKPYGMMPFSKAELEFEILIPKDWEVIETPDASSETAQQIISRIAVYRSPMIGVLQCEVYVDALKLKNDIAAKHWLKHYMLTSGFSPEGEIESPNTKHASSYYVKSGDPGAPSTKEYISATISGTWVLLATFQCPLPLSNYIKFLQKKTVESFKILYPKDEPVEDQKVFTLVDSIKFGYPTSWEVVTTDFRDMNRLSVHMQNKNTTKTVDGFIRFVAVRRSRSNDLLSEVGEQQKYFSDTLKLNVTKMLSSDKSPAYDRFLFNRYEVYAVAPKSGKGTPQEVHMAVLCDKEWYIFGYLFTPTEATNLYQWARNLQSFQEILKATK